MPEGGQASLVRPLSCQTPSARAHCRAHGARRKIRGRGRPRPADTPHIGCVPDRRFAYCRSCLRQGACRRRPVCQLLSTTPVATRDPPLSAQSRPRIGYAAKSVDRSQLQTEPRRVGQSSALNFRHDGDAQPLRQADRLRQGARCGDLLEAQTSEKQADSSPVSSPLSHCRSHRDDFAFKNMAVNEARP